MNEGFHDTTERTSGAGFLRLQSAPHPPPWGVMSHINQQHWINWSGAAQGCHYGTQEMEESEELHAMQLIILLCYQRRIQLQGNVFFVSNPRLPRRMSKYCALSIQPNVRFDFSANSSSEWNSTFQNFQKRRQPREVYSLKFQIFFPGSYLSIQLYSRNFQNLRLNGSPFEIQQEFLDPFRRNFCTICR